MQRRHFVLAAPAALLAACGRAAETGGPAGDRADLGLLHTALELERAAIAIYTAGIGIGGRARPLLEQIREHEHAHAAALREAIADLRAGPRPAQRPDHYTADLPALRSEAAFLGFAERFERRTAAAYSAALPRVRTERLRGLLGAIGGAEAAHATALADRAGGDPLARVLELAS